MFDPAKKESGWSKLYYEPFAPSPHLRSAISQNINTIKIGKPIRSGDFKGYTVIEVDTDGRNLNVLSCQTYAFRIDGEGRLEIRSGRSSYVQGDTSKPDIKKFFEGTSYVKLVRLNTALPPLRD